MKYEFEECTHDMGGIHRLYKFPNGYGASVVRFRMPLPMGPFKYGSYTNDEWEWEVAVVELGEPRPDGKFSASFELTYSTPITDSVLGHVQDGDELEALLDKIAALPSRVVEATP